MTPLRLFVALAALSFAVSACKKAEIATYRVPKEKEAAMPAAATAAPAPAAPSTAAPGGQAGMAQTAVATAQGGPLVWTAPAQWKTKAASAMRKGSYSIPGEGGEADMSVTAFPGDVGGDLANLNRWRGQVSLPPVTQADFEKQTQHIDHNDLHMTVADILGTGIGGRAERILGAMVPHGGNTWFFKMQGPDAIVAKEKAAFMAMLETIKPAAPAQ